jgi:PAS domain S-box-containing protein
MTIKDNHPTSAADLRKQAEEKAAQSSENSALLSPEQIQQTLHELRVHQIELEMQNEELRQSQTDLCASQARYFDLYDVAPIGYCTLSETGVILEANLTSANLLGVARGALVKHSLNGFIHQEDQDNYYSHRRQLFASYEPATWELRMVKKDGTAFWAGLDAAVVQEKNGEFVCRIVLKDITGRKQAEIYREMGREVLQILNEPGDFPLAIQRVLAALKTRTGFEALGIRLQNGDDFPYFVHDGFSENFLSTENTLAERAAHGGVCLDIAGNINLECTCGQVISGKTDAENPCFTKGGSFWTNDKAGVHFHDTRLHPRNRCLHDGFQSVALVPIRNKNRIVGLIQLNDRRKRRLTLEIVELLEGITSHIGSALLRKKSEETLSNVQKLESLSVLAGGIAHDFNNLLGGIYGYIELAGESAKDEKLSRYLSKAMTTIERARGLTLQLLTFAKGGAPIKKIGSLFPYVQETAQFALSGSNVLCKFEIPKNLSSCDFDKNQIGQVIDNIVINAKQAMPDGGDIVLSARNMTIAENEHPPLDSGDYIMISIKDTGIGIPKNILPRIFDPFYTTKATGHGLGLASCYSIVNRHGGFIEVESEPGKGSTFYIFLPVSKGSNSAGTENVDAIHKGNGVFLVMEDQIIMRDVIGDMLESLGYTAVCKGNGKETIEFVSSKIRANKEIAGMIFDLTIPGGMGGKEAIGEIRKTNPKTPIFVTSGYATDSIMVNPSEYGFTASICKPFRKSELSEMLNKYMKPKK